MNAVYAEHEQPAPDVTLDAYAVEFNEQLADGSWTRSRQTYRAAGKARHRAVEARFRRDRPDGQLVKVRRER